MSRDFQYDVFLSHSSTDRDFVRDLDRKLRAIGVATFFDERDIPWGANIPQAIEEALDKSRHLILVLSPDSVGSDWVALERCVQIFEAPSGGERSILPLLYRDCDVLPPAVRIRRYLAVRSDEEFEQAWPQIVTFLTNDPPRRQIHVGMRSPAVTHGRRCIGVVTPLFGASTIFYTALLAAIWRQAGNHGYELLILPLGEFERKPHLALCFPQLPSVSGLIFITCQVEGSTWLEECASLELPVVLVHDNIAESHARGHTVIAYLRPRLDALVELVTMLIEERNRENFVVVMVRPDGHALRTEKLATLENAFRGYGISFDHSRQLFYVSEYSFDEGRRIVSQILETAPESDAIICLADATACGVLQRLTELNLANRVSVSGFDNVDFAIQASLTTIDQGLRVTGETALRHLHKAIQNSVFEEFRIGEYISTQLIRRTSA